MEILFSSKASCVQEYLHFVQETKKETQRKKRKEIRVRTWYKALLPSNPRVCGGSELTSGLAQIETIFAVHAKRRKARQDKREVSSLASFYFMSFS